jgi:LuxR family transcriptional regulator, maltose regulon positive regulatory protein
MHRDEVDGNWIWHRICNKIHEYNKPLYDRVAHLSLPQSDQEMSYMIRMLNTYVVREEYLIMDDYQESNSPWFDKLLENIAINVPNLHIVLISRTYPDIPYEEMFLKGYCAVINQQNLTLTVDETRDIFTLNSMKLTDEELEDLYEYTDGWISAVYLSLYEYKKKGSFGSFLGVNHLLKTAIYDKLSPFMQQFFMRVSLFDWFELEEARYVTQMDISETALFESQERFGFLHYDVRSRSFQMHAR